MAPRVQTHLKFDEKVKVIQLYAEDSSLNFRKFTEKVKFRLNLSVSRSTVQRIIKDKDRILSVPEKYRASCKHNVDKLQQEFETVLLSSFFSYFK